MLKNVSVLVLSGMLCFFIACGSDNGFDEFRGRPATVEDLENKSFTFSFVANGAPFDPALGDRPTTLIIGEFDESDSAPFTLEVADGSAAGTAVFDASLLSLTVEAVSGNMPFSIDQEILLDVQADIDDGRISVTNTETGLESTSEPN